MTTTTPALETETCTRCGGSGHYSYCQTHGTRCFKCGGRGRTLTKRGAVASDYLRSLRSKPAGELKVGDVVEYRGLGGTYWITIESVEPSKAQSWVNGVPWDHSNDVDYVGVRNDGERCGMMGIPKSSPVRVAQTAEQSAETLAKAVEFQATLTKAGTPRKSARKVA